MISLRDMAATYVSNLRVRIQEVKEDIKMREEQLNQLEEHLKECEEELHNTNEQKQVRFDD